MTMRPAFRLKFVLLLLLVCVSCGDTFRPVATPLIPSPPSPAAFHTVLMLTRNGPNNRGASSDIDVSGDSNVAVAPLGLGPAHATLIPNSSRLFVANNLEDTVSSFSPNTTGPVITTSLPPGSMPVYVHTTENANVYVANFCTNFCTDPSNPNGTVAAIATASDAVVNPLIPVGKQPVALAETSDGTKLYAVNEGDGTVTSIHTATLAATTTIATGSAPVWALARPDAVQVQPLGFRVYVLNSGSGTLSTIDTATDTKILPDVSVGVGANFMVYDKTRTRLYVVNPNSTSVMVLDASKDPPATVNPPIDLTQASAGTASLCATACHPVSIAVLPNGTRAYVVSYAVASNTIEWQVSVVNLQDNTIRTQVPADPTATLTSIDTVNPTGCGASPFGASPLPFRMSVVAAADSSKVYIASCDSGMIEAITTFDDTLISSLDGETILSLPAPPSTFQSPPVNITAASQNGSIVTYTYTPVTGPVLRVGEFIAVTGMGSCPSSASSFLSDNGTFTISALGPGTITVGNSAGCTLSQQNGTGVPTVAQNPVFLLAGP